MQTYTVKWGDSLSRIATAIYRDPTRWRLLATANQISDPRRLFVGQTLVLPEGDADHARQTVESAAWTASIKLSEKRLARLAPALAEKGRELVQRCHEAGVHIRVAESLRTWTEQDALYASGRTRPGKVVTNARGGESFHNFGLAFDIVLLGSADKVIWDAQHAGWGTAGRIGVALGLLWGGNWKGFRDLPHFEMRGQLTLADCRVLFPAGLEEIWKRVN